MIKLEENKYLVLFDGVCNLCDAAVQWIIKYDKKNRFLFSPLQGETAAFVLNRFKFEDSQTDSIVLYMFKNKVYTKSSAALRIASKLQFPVNLLSVFLIVPKLLRDWIYDLVAKHRYRCFGKKKECMVPTEQLKFRFLK